MNKVVGNSRGFAGTLLYVTGGILVWAANFLVTYVFTAVACARGFASGTSAIGVISIVTFVSCAVAVLANAAIIRHAWSRRTSRGDPDARQGTEGFVDFMAAAIASLSTLAVFYTALAGVLPARC